MLRSFTPHGSHRVYTFVTSRGRIRACMQRFENITIDVYTLNVHCTNLRSAEQGTVPPTSGVHCTGRPTGDVPRSCAESICLPASVYINIGLSCWRFQSLTTSTSTPRACGKAKVSFSFLFSGKSSRVTRHVIRDVNPSIREAEYDNTLTLCLGCCGRLHIFFSLLMTSTPVIAFIRIRFSEYSTVTAMIPAEESASSGIKLFLSYFPISPIRIIA